MSSEIHRPIFKYLPDDFPVFSGLKQGNDLEFFSRISHQQLQREIVKV